MITQFYRAGISMIKVVIKDKEVKIFDANRARQGVTATQMLERDAPKREKWNKFMAKNPSERKIADELEGDFINNYGCILEKEEVAA